MTTSNILQDILVVLTGFTVACAALHIKDGTHVHFIAMAFLCTTLYFAIEAHKDKE